MTSLSPHRVKVIANPAAGRQDQPMLHIMNRVFRRFNIRWKFALTHKNGDGAKAAKKAVKKDWMVSFRYHGTQTSAFGSCNSGTDSKV